jgi:diguanylate cyclase (GGDEF)-like protein
MNDMSVARRRNSRVTGPEGEDVAAENRLLKVALDAAQVRIAELELIADTDTLTPLANRRAFLRELDRKMKNAARHQTSAALLFIDLDGLKSVNDAFGHQAGDALIIHVAQGLRGMVRATDVVARLGGDEFGLILEHLDEAQARTKADAIVAALSARPLMFGKAEIPVTPSCGVAMIREEESAESAIARADAEMYLIKSAHRSDK